MNCEQLGFGASSREAISASVNQVPVSLRILVVEDDEEMRRLIGRVLTNAGHQVITASDGKEATRGMEEGRIDLLLTDVLMPEIDGLETIGLFRARHLAARVIAMSGGGVLMSGALCLDLAQKLGADQILMKPFSLTELLAAVQPQSEVASA
jgi:DNA-binding response OmpR family regulator